MSFTIKLLYMYMYIQYSPPLSVCVCVCAASCLPLIPEQGTVGASGDLAPLSHLALGLMGEGLMWSPTSGWANAAEVREKIQHLCSILLYYLHVYHYNHWYIPCIRYRYLCWCVCVLCVQYIDVGDHDL